MVVVAVVVLLMWQFCVCVHSLFVSRLDLTRERVGGENGRPFLWGRGGGVCAKRGLGKKVKGEESKTHPKFNLLLLLLAPSRNVFVSQSTEKKYINSFFELTGVSPVRRY